jgi:hypothetical protein
VHILTGGTYGCDMFDSLYKEGYIADEDTAKRMCVIWSPVILKTAYRYHYITPKKDCVVNLQDARLSECGFDCDSTMTDKLVDYIASLRYTGDQLNLNFSKVRYDVSPPPFPSLLE